MNSISVITPSLNQGYFIERTIQSVLQQEINALEFIVLDGGSTDETLAILSKYQGQVRWISEPDNGQADAVNKGISATTGDIIAWINSDDIYYPNTLRIVQRYFSDNPDVDVVYGDAFHIDENDHEIEPYYTEPWNVERLKEVCYLCQPAVFFRRRVISQYGLLNENLHFCMDYEYWLRLAIHGAVFAYISTPFAGSRMYAQNKTLSRRVHFHAEINNMMKEKFKKVPDAWLYNYAHAVVDDRNISRNTRKYSLTVAWKSIVASFLWNHSVSKEMIHTTAEWIGWNNFSD